MAFQGKLELGSSHQTPAGGSDRPEPMASGIDLGLASQNWMSWLFWLA